MLGCNSKNIEAITLHYETSRALKFFSCPTSNTFHLSGNISTKGNETLHL